MRLLKRILIASSVDVGSRIDSFSIPGHGGVGNITGLRTYRVASNKVQCVGTWVIGPIASKTIGFNLETRGSNAYTYGL